MEKKLPLKWGALAATTALVLTGCWGNTDPEPDPTPSETVTSQAPEPETSATDPATSDATPPAPTPDSESSSEPAPADFSDFTSEPQSSADFPNDYTMGTSPMYLTEVRLGIHEGYDRVVFEHSGDGTLSYKAAYTAEPIEHGSGFTVDMNGEAYLQVSVSGVSFDTEEDMNQMFSGPVAGAATQSNVIEDVHTLALFEGQTEYFIGLDQERDFHVFTLDDPVRVVVDIRQ